MCKICEEHAANINKDFFKAMQESKEDYDAFAYKMAERFKSLLLVTLPPETEEIIQANPEMGQQLKENYERTVRAVSVTAALGWFSAMEQPDSNSLQNLMPFIVDTLTGSVNDGNAYRNVSQQVKH